MFKTVCLIFCFLTISISGCGVHEPLTLISDGTVMCDIVIPQEATDTEQFAAEELRTYLKKMTGLDVLIVRGNNTVQPAHFYIGETEAGMGAKVPSGEPDKLKEGFGIRRVKDGLVIRGFSDLGTLYGVYTYLEELGIRWYVPGELGEVIPSADALILEALQIEEQPDYPYRWIGTNEWSRRNKCNVNLPMNEQTIGIKVWRAFHTFGALLHPDNYYHDHQEYFPLVQGKRRYQPPRMLQGADILHGNQFETSNPEVVKQVAVNMGNVLDADPQIQIITLGPNDGSGYCQCTRCTSLDEKNVPHYQSMSQRLLLFFNAVSQIIDVTHPGKIVKFGAYHAYTVPPDDPDLKALDNMQVMIAHYEDYANSLAINDPNSGRNARFRKLLDGWKPKVNSMFFYEYYWKVNWLGLPWPIVHSIAEDIPYLHREYNAEGMFTQYTGDVNAWSRPMNYYVAAKLIWDIDIDVAELLDEYYVKFYGTASEPMKSFYEAFEQAFINSNLEFPGNADLLAHYVFPPELLDRCDQLLLEAVQLADNNLIRQRIEKLQIMMEYTRELMRFLRPLNRARAQTMLNYLLPSVDPKSIEIDPVDVRLKLFDEAYLIGKEVVENLRKDRDRYHGVINMNPMVNPNQYLDRRLDRIKGWRQSVLEEEQKPAEEQML